MATESDSEGARTEAESEAPESESEGPTSESEGPTSESEGPRSESESEGPTSEFDSEAEGPKAESEGPTSESEGPKSESDSEGPTSESEGPTSDSDSEGPTSESESEAERPMTESGSEEPKADSDSESGSEEPKADSESGSEGARTESDSAGPRGTAGGGAPALPPGEVLARVNAVDVRRWWKPLWVEPISWEVLPGVTGLIGPAGAGKTTLLRLLLGLEKPAAGKVEVLGLRLPRQGALARTRVGFVPQDLALYPGMSALQLAELHGELHATWQAGELYARLARWQVPTREPVERLAPLARSLLALGLALSHAPGLLLVDLPTALDAAGRTYLLDVLAAERGELPVVIASARPHELEGRCERLALLARGRLRHFAPAEALGEGLVRCELAGDARPELPAGVTCLRAAPAPGGARWWLSGTSGGIASLRALEGVSEVAPAGFEEAYLARLAE